MEDPTHDEAVVFNYLLKNPGTHPQEIYRALGKNHRQTIKRLMKRGLVKAVKVANKQSGHRYKYKLFPIVIWRNEEEAKLFLEAFYGYVTDEELKLFLGVI